jgi:arabinose-5-phosphate isomerase
VLRRFQVPTLAIVGKASSTLGRRCDIVFDIGVEREACPLNLAPTTSTLATLAIGDALAVALMKRRQFAAADFARFHPGGALGRRLFEDAATVLVDVSERAAIRT